MSSDAVPHLLCFPLEVCRFLVDELGASPTEAQPTDGRTAMHWAARNGRLEVCRWLVAEAGVPTVGRRSAGTAVLTGVAAFVATGATTVR